MALSIVLVICGIVVIIAILRARAKGKDSNGPMNNN
jgi:hypothetical protein